MRTFAIMAAIVLGSALSQAQDVIVKKDGSTILSSVIEVSDTEVTYKKHSNPKGPTYKIKTSELLSINYKNGEKDDFGNISQQKQNSVDVSQNSANTEITTNRNSDYINTFNNTSIIYNGGRDKAQAVYCTLGLCSGSQVMDNNIVVEYTIGEYHQSQKHEGKLFTKGYASALRHWDFGLITTIKNLTNQTIYIDLSNCFFSSWNGATCNYINKETVLAISPQSEQMIGYQPLDFLCDFKSYASYPTYRGKLRFATPNIRSKGDRMQWSEANSPLYWSTCYTYSFDSNLADKKMVKARFFVKDATGGGWNKFYSQPEFGDFAIPQNTNVLYIYGNFKD